MNCLWVYDSGQFVQHNWYGGLFANTRTTQPHSVIHAHTTRPVPHCLLPPLRYMLRGRGDTGTRTDRDGACACAPPAPRLHPASDGFLPLDNNKVYLLYE